MSLAARVERALNRVSTSYSVGARQGKAVFWRLSGPEQSRWFPAGPPAIPSWGMLAGPGDPTLEGQTVVFAGVSSVVRRRCPLLWRDQVVAWLLVLA